MWDFNEWLATHRHERVIILVVFGFALGRLILATWG